MSTPVVLADRLRAVCASVRTKSFPLADLIPLMQEAADALSADRVDAARWRALQWYWEDERDMGPGGRYWTSVNVSLGRPATPGEAVDANRGVS